jgi:hypothetical protein
LSELDNAFFKLLDVESVSFLLLLHKRSDLLFHMLLDVFKLFPLLGDFGVSFDLVVNFGNLGVLEQEESFI